MTILMDLRLGYKESYTTHAVGSQCNVLSCTYTPGKRPHHPQIGRKISTEWMINVFFKVKVILFKKKKKKQQLLENKLVMKPNNFREVTEVRSQISANPLKIFFFK